MSIMETSCGATHPQWQFLAPSPTPSPSPSPSPTPAPNKNNTKIVLYVSLAVGGILLLYLFLRHH